MSQKTIKLDTGTTKVELPVITEKLNKGYALLDIFKNLQESPIRQSEKLLDEAGLLIANLNSIKEQDLKLDPTVENTQIEQADAILDDVIGFLTENINRISILTSGK